MSFAGITIGVLLKLLLLVKATLYTRARKKVSRETLDSKMKQLEISFPSFSFRTHLSNQGEKTNKVTGKSGLDMEFWEIWGVGTYADSFPIP